MAAGSSKASSRERILDSPTPVLERCRHSEVTGVIILDEVREKLIFLLNLRLKFGAVTEWALKVVLKPSSLQKGQAHERVGKVEEMKGSFCPPPRPSQLSHPRSLERPDSTRGTTGMTSSLRSRPSGALTVMKSSVLGSVGALLAHFLSIL